MNDYVRALRAELLKLRVVLLFIRSLDARERFGASAWPNLAGITLAMGVVGAFDITRRNVD